MSKRGEFNTYVGALEDGFRKYREARYPNGVDLFKPTKTSRATVFAAKHRAHNILIPPFATEEERDRIVGTIRAKQRHRHFGSMRSSQALAQSVFGAIAVFERLSLLSSVTAECGLRAFGDIGSRCILELEKSIESLGEPRSTSVDVWLDGNRRVAIECKLTEAEFGTCSRPRLKSDDPEYEAQYCDGTYTRQRERSHPCALTEIDVKYWLYARELFGWKPEIEHRPCPLELTYQLARNAMAACVGENGILHPDQGHALIIYDGRNPAMVSGGDGYRQWQSATTAMRVPGLLRRISWQSLIDQWPRDMVLDWLRVELEAKYGLGFGSL